MKLLMLVCALAMTSCACAGEASRNSPMCVIKQNIVDCTTDSAIAVAPQFLPVVAQLFALVTGGDGAIDWARVETALLSLGLRDGGCILAALENEFASASPTAGPKTMRRAQSFHDGFAAYRQTRWPGVHFKLLVAGKEVVR